MRTTLTVDDDIAEALRRLSSASRHGFKEVVNETLRRGLSAGPRPQAPAAPFVIEAAARGFLPGIDPLKLNALADEIETDAFIERHRTRRSRRDRSGH